MDIALLQTVMTALGNLGFSWLVGILFARICLQRDQSDWSCRAQIRLGVANTIVLMLCIVCNLGLQWCEAATLGDTPFSEAGPALVLLLQSTHYGHVGLTGLTALLGLTGAHLILKTNSGVLLVNVLLLLVVALSKVAVSHASEAGLFSGAAAIELVHLLLIWFWTGSVCVSGWHVLPGAANPNPAVSNYLKSLSFYATLALGGIVATGLLNAAHILWQSSNLVGQPYTTLVLIKIGLVLLAAALGGFNRFASLPDLTEEVTPLARRSILLHRVVLVLKIESLVLITTLFIAAVLASTAPP